MSSSDCDGVKLKSHYSSASVQEFNATPSYGGNTDILCPLFSSRAQGFNKTHVFITQGFKFRSPFFHRKPLQPPHLVAITDFGLNECFNTV